MSRGDEVWSALGAVRDPELDEPITDLKFVTEVEISGGDVRVRLRLPTYFCAPNFAYLMVADAHDVLTSLDWTHHVTVRLDDHFASEEINGGVAADAGFSGSFPGQAEGELEQLRNTFRRKAHTACLERSCRSLLEEGWEIEGLTRAHLSDLPSGSATESLLRRRADLGLTADPQAPLLVNDDGTPVDDVPRRLRYARTVRVSIDGNGIFCRGLLETRYGTADIEGTFSGIEVRKAS
ncbi:iron-sulfur cluster assembly protein [Kineosporia succinea]|uniref:Metal-sulfur cluster biosynthetic enzyme n=1 Tax=Kineosporia succinea TaxID=84632 RepID=A0ABT9P4X7_9ACTN|nr:iron-sulfur cluster assembly protein [Kineosporia succinea]MDP9827749.1 metal-sulfur cluster biosynthetic enzyme [Kineosporia succinea]